MSDSAEPHDGADAPDSSADQPAEPLPHQDRPRGPALIWRGVVFGVGTSAVAVAALWLSPIFFLALPLWLIFGTMSYVAFCRGPIWHFLPFLLPLLATAYWAWDPLASLPARAEVWAGEYVPGKDQSPRPLSPAQVDRLLAALRPAYREWAPDKWSEIGRFRLALHRGETVEIIWLKDETTEWATFSVLPNYGPPHYRGGTRAEMERLVEELMPPR